MSPTLQSRTPPPQWLRADIIYVSIVGAVMLLALLEWLLWLLAFLFCLAKVIRKADSWSVRILAVLNMGFFTAMRCAFLPVMLVTLPLPQVVVEVFPEGVRGALQWVSFALVGFA